jgi:hypothetical protein
MSGLLDIVLGAAGLAGQDQAAPRVRLPFESGDGALSGEIVDFAEEREVVAAEHPNQDTATATALPSRPRPADPMDRPAARLPRAPRPALETPRSAEPPSVVPPPPNRPPLKPPPDASVAPAPLPRRAADTSDLEAPIRPRRPEETRAARPRPGTAADEFPVRSRQAAKDRRSPPPSADARLVAPEAPAPKARTAALDTFQADQSDRGAVETPLRPSPPSPGEVGSDTLAGHARRGAPAAAPPRLEISFGRIEIELARPAEPAPQAAPRVSGPSRGFEGYGAARRGWLR